MINMFMLFLNHDKKEKDWIQYSKLWLVLILLLLFSSCNKYLSELSIFSNLQEGDSISVALYSKNTEQYYNVNGINVTSEDVVRGRIDVSLPDSVFRNILALAITVNCRSDTILVISSILLKGHPSFYPQDIMNSLWWQEGLMFEVDSLSNTIKSHIYKDVQGTFPIGIAYIYRPYPIGIYLIFRYILITIFFILIFFLTFQASTQRLLLFSIALFLASLPLSKAITIYTMSIMGIAMVVCFIYNKSRRFTWHPIFYVLCAIYLINVIGLLYTGDINQGIKNLDSTVVLVLFPLFFSTIQFTQKNVVLLLRFFVWMVITFCAFGFLSYATIVPEITGDMLFRDSKLYAPLLMMWPAHGHSSFLSTILLMAIPVALYLYNYKTIEVNGKRQTVKNLESNRSGLLCQKPITVIEMLVGILFPVVFTVLSGARVGMAIIPLLFVLGYLFYCKFKPALKWGLLVVGIVTVGIFLYLNPNVSERFNDPIRVNLQKTAISAIKEKPVFGWGTGYARQLINSEERALSIGLEAPTYMPNFHNQFLEDMVQFGIPGIVILLTLFGWMLWIGIREKNFLMLSLFIIYVVFCCTENALAISKGVVPFVFWVCFLLTKKGDCSYTEKSREDTEKHRVFVI